MSLPAMMMPKVLNPEKGYKLPSVRARKLSHDYRVSMAESEGGINMWNCFRRLLMAIAAFALFMPVGLSAQQSDDTNQPQTQDSQSQPPAGQPKGHRGMRHGRHGSGMAGLAQKLNLSDDQKQQFRHIRQQSMEQARTIRTDSSLTEDQKRAKMQELRKQSHQQMFSLLTPEQKEQLKQLREQRQKEMQDKEKDKGSGAQASAKHASGEADDDDPFAGMTSDDDFGPGNGG